ncbi:hypothetical protein J4410_07415 [Candidatus Woesearchaeota archaeon]|nr:hypothetical protein [Candidatus Woesearchaeota archaeon]
MKYILTTSLIILFMVGCATPEMPSQPSEEMSEEIPKEQEPTLPPSNEVMSEDVIKVEDTTLDDLNDLQTDLDLTDLDSLEDDLSDIEDLNF